MEVFQEELNAAVARYEEDTKHQLAPTTLKAYRSITTPEDLANLIEAAGAAFKDFRSRNGRLWSSLRKFVAPVVSVAWLGTTPASVLPFGAASSALLAAVIFLVRACDGVSHAYDWIDQIFCELQEFSTRLDVYIKGDLEPMLCKKIAAILAFIIQVLGRCEKLIRERRFKQYLKVVFLGKDAETNKLVSDLNKLFGSEHRLVLAVTYASAQRAEQNTKEINDTVHQTDKSVKKVLGVVKDNHDQISKAEASHLLKLALCHTSAFDNVEETFAKNKRLLLNGTGDWLLQEPLFNSWMTQRATVLWIFGGPGTGKSYLSTWIVKELIEKPDRDSPVAYFFIKENNANLRDANIILKTLAWQLADQNSEFKHHAIEVCRDHKRTITATDTWENLFLRFYAESVEDRTATIVIDGLDEATSETRRTLLGFIKDMMASHNTEQPTLQFAIVGRGSLRGDMDFKRLEKMYFVEISKDKNKKNIDNFIRKRLGDFQLLREMRKMKPDGLKKANRLGGMIARKVSDSADGVFLWAKLFLDSLVEKDRNQIEAALANPPSTMDDMIRSVFEHLSRDDGPDHEVLRKLLLFMAYSRRPLLFAELDIVTSLPSRKPNYLLWKQTRGILSSVFDLKFPDGVDPDSDDEEKHEEKADTTHVDGDNVKNGNVPDEDNDQSFDFTDTDDDNTTVTSGDEDDIFSQTTEQSLSNATSDKDTNAEEDLYVHLSYGQLHTEVAFCHARIRDYIVREGNPKKRHNPVLPIIPLATSAQADITLACIEIFRLECSLKDEQRYLCDYPLCHMAVHLEHVDRQSISLDLLAKIVEGLYWLFGTETGTFCHLKSVGRYDDFHGSHSAFWQLWVKTDRYLKLLQTWFKEVGNVKEHIHLEESTYSWMQKAADSLEELLRPMMKTASTMWLCKPGFDSDEYKYKGEFEASLMHGWLSQIETGSTTPEIEEYQFEFGQFFPKIPPERIEYLANWADLEHDVHWHTCLGWILMEGLHHEACQFHFNKAIELFPQAWVAFQGSGISFGLQKKWKEAISLMEKAIDNLPPSMSKLNAYLYPRISDWASSMNDREKSEFAAQKGFDADPSSPMAQLRIFKALREKGDSKALVSNLQFLDSKPCENERHSLLVHFFVKEFSAYDEIGWACRRQGKPQFIVDAMDKAANVFDEGDREWRNVFLQYVIATFKYLYYGRDEEAMVHWTTFIELLSRRSDSIQSTYKYARDTTTNRLAQIYFDRAVDAWKNNNQEEATTQANELKKLAVAVATGFRDDYEGFDLFCNDYPAMLWGRWLKDYHKANESLWKKCFRTRLLEEIKRLDDDDPDNDTEAATSLAKSLFHTGDRKNAGAILAFLFKNADINENESARNSNDGEKNKLETEGQAQEATEEESLEQEPIQMETLQVREVQDSQKETTENGIQGEMVVSKESAEVKNAPERAEAVTAENIEGKTISSNDSTKDKAPLVLTNSKDPSSQSMPVEGEDGVKLKVEKAPWVCDSCEKGVSEVSKLYFCEICPDINWCGECFALFQDPEQKEKLAYHLCNPKHDFYLAWPIPEEAKYLAIQPYEHDVTLRRAWLENLRNEWWK